MVHICGLNSSFGLTELQSLEKSLTVILIETWATCQHRSRGSEPAPHLSTPQSCTASSRMRRSVPSSPPRPLNVFLQQHQQTPAPPFCPHPPIISSATFLPSSPANINSSFQTHLELSPTPWCVCPHPHEDESSLSVAGTMSMAALIIHGAVSSSPWLHG